MSIPGGYILQPRCIDDSDIMHEPPVVRELWFYLLRRVNHTDNGKYKRGSGFFNLGEIQDALHWYSGYRKMKYSKPQLTKSLRKLRERNMVATAKATHGVYVTILNYDYYQNPDNYGGNAGGQTEETRRKQRGHTKNKNEKECKNVRSKSPNGDSSPNFDSVTASAPPECPHKKIIAIYHEELPELPAVQVWGDSSRGNLKARWREDPARQAPEWWRWFFCEYIRTSDFLMGRVKEWQASLDWIVRPRNFQKIMNGLYVNKGGCISQKRRETARELYNFIENGGDE